MSERGFELEKVQCRHKIRDCDVSTVIELVYRTTEELVQHSMLQSSSDIVDNDAGAASPASDSSSVVQFRVPISEFGVSMRKLSVA